MATDAAYHREWARKNKTRRRELNEAYRKKQRLEYEKLKEGLVCSNCGEDRTPCLDFHHTDPNNKDFELGNVGNRGYSTARMQEEIDKCVVLCANCHRMEHYNQKNASLAHQVEQLTCN